MTVCTKAAKGSKKHDQAVAKASAKMNVKFKEEPKGQKKGDDPKWKKQHEELMESMKYNRQIKKCEEEGGDFSKIKAPTSNYDHYVECPYCGRKYDKEVAERHIPKCKDIINKPNPVKKPSSLTNSPYKSSNTNTPLKTSTPQKTAMGGKNLGGKSGFGGGGERFGANNQNPFSAGSGAGPFGGGGGGAFGGGGAGGGSKGGFGVQGSGYNAGGKGINSKKY